MTASQDYNLHPNFFFYIRNLHPTLMLWLTLIKDLWPFFEKKKWTTSLLMLRMIEDKTDLLNAQLRLQWEDHQPYQAQEHQNLKSRWRKKEEEIKHQLARIWIISKETKYIKILFPTPNHQRASDEWQFTRRQTRKWMAWAKKMTLPI